MSEAERLAKALEACDRSGMWYPSTEAAAELRRLSAELEALKKAISEAEPEAWQYREARDDGTWGAWVGCDKLLAEDKYRQVRQLYALKVIK